MDHPWVVAIQGAPLSERSKEQYVRNLEKLRELSGDRSLETIIAHPKAMKQRIEHAYDNMQTRKALVAAIRAIFKYNDSVKDAYPEQYESWTKIGQDLDKHILDRVGTAQPTERELVNWVNWSDVLKKQRELSTVEYGSTDHLLLSMYTLMEPMRSDFGNLKVYLEDHQPYLGTTDENYIVLSSYPGKSRIILNEFKTKKRYGTFSRPIPDELVRIIVRSLELNPREYVFVNDAGEPYTKKNSYTKFTNRILERLFQKKFTISLLRHSFISGIDFNQATPGQLMQYSKNMMHSMGMQQLYRRRIPEVRVVKVEKGHHYDPPRPDGNPNKTPNDTKGRIILL